jgi:hypothetical protein
MKSKRETKKELIERNLKKILLSRGLIEIPTAVCWHIKEKGDDYIVFCNRCCDGHELKMFFDMEDLDEFLVFGWLKSKPIDFSVCIELSLLINSWDVEKQKKPKRAKVADEELTRKVIQGIKEMKKMGMKKFYESDISELIGEDHLRVIGILRKLKELEMIKNERKK